MSEKSIIPRKFRIGQWVRTATMTGKVIGSAIYGVYTDKLGGYNISPQARVEYRIRVPGKTKTFYRRESELRAADPPKK
jgi:hypothetical protein